MIERHQFLYTRTQGVCVNDVTVYSGGKMGKTSFLQKSIIGAIILAFLTLIGPINPVSRRVPYILTEK